jgi:hypothetical protein
MATARIFLPTWAARELAYKFTFKPFWTNYNYQPKKVKGKAIAVTSPGGL